MADDAITEVLHTLRVAGAFHCDGRLRPPFAVRIESEGLPVFHHVAVGSARVTFDDGRPPVELLEGDFILFPNAPTRIVSDGEDSVTPTPLAALVDVRQEAGARVFEHGGEGPESLIVGCGILVEGIAAEFVLSTLPQQLLIRQATIGPAFAAQLTALRAEGEAAERASGILVTRSSEMVFLHALRWFLREQPANELRGWCAAVRDPRLKRALLGIHRDYAQAWTLERVARSAGMSRSRFAAAFSAMIGLPPRAYLTRVRMDRAQEFLARPEVSLADIGARVGYRSEAAFTTAFKRQCGSSPGEYRKNLPSS